MPRARTTRKTKAEESAILEAVKDLKPEDVVNQIGELQLKMQSTLAGLSAVIAGKVEQKEKVDEAIALKERELAEVYEIEREVTSLEDLRSQREEDDANWRKNLDDRRKAWEEETKERNKRWMREQEEHDYNTQQKEKAWQDAFDAQVERTQRAEANRQQDLERQWNERERGLREKEIQFTELTEKVAAFPEELKKEVAKAEAIVENRLKTKFQHEAALAAKDAESEKALFEARATSLRAKVNDLEEEVRQLHDQLAIARKDVNDVTAKALESASGRQVAQALQKVVDTGVAPAGKNK